MDSYSVLSLCSYTLFSPSVLSLTLSLSSLVPLYLAVSLFLTLTEQRENKERDDTTNGQQRERGQGNNKVIWPWLGQVEVTAQGDELSWLRVLPGLKITQLRDRYVSTLSLCCLSFSAVHLLCHLFALYSLLLGSLLSLYCLCHCALYYPLSLCYAPCFLLSDAAAGFHMTTHFGWSQSSNQSCTSM